MFPTIMIIDDEPSILQSLGGLLSDEGFEILTASNGYEGLKMIEQEAPDLILLDIWMPGIDGIETLKEIKKIHPFLPVIIITGHGNIETAVKATKLGAFDLIEKPLSIDKIIVDINNALNFMRLEEENRFLRKKTIEKNAINGSSPATKKLIQQISVIAPTDSWILITGENGTGKELVARSIHQFSQRAEQALIDINCAAIPEERLESELFGHEKGAVEWSDNRQRGRLEIANKGTLFLDEIGDMKPEIQAKLLRVLQEQTFQRVGGGRTINVDVRVIAATNKDIEAEIQKGNFRQDLFYRLNEIPLAVPALRDRREDIPVLVNIFLDERAKQNGTPKKQISSQAMDMLCQYQWPGNIRELKNLMGRLSVMVEKDIIEIEDLPNPYNPQAEKGPGRDNTLFSLDNIAQATELFKKEFIKRKYYQLNQDIDKTAKTIGIDLENLKKQLKGIS